MHIPDEITIPRVTPQQFALLREYFKENDGSGCEGESGLAENPCFASKYKYDSSSEILTLEPVRLMPNLKPARLKKLIEQILNPPPQELAVAAGETIYKPTPHSCATYNRVIGFITNNSGGPLTYKTNSTSHGDFHSKVNKIPEGNTPVKQKDDGVFQNQGTKDSTLGCFGSVTYQLADGLTTLEISYGVNTLSTTSANAGLGAQNAARYEATCDKETHFYYACAYLYPYVTISKV